MPRRFFMYGPVMASRIVSLVPSMTETVCMLGAAGRLVGVTRYCVVPARELEDVPRVGGTKNPKLDQISDLEPDLVLVNSEENRRDHIAWLRQRFPVLEHMPRTVAEAAEEVRDLARRLGAMELAQPLLLEIEAQLARAQVEGLRLGPVRVFYPIWRKPWMSINRSTFVHDVLRRSGALNVCGDLVDRYPELREEDLAGLAPDLVLLPSEPWEFDEAQREELEAAATFGSCPLLCVDGRDFCWHGGRTGAALGRVLDLLLPFRPIA